MSLLKNTLSDIEDRLQAGETLMFLQTDDEPRWLDVLQTFAEENDRPLYVWSLSTGLISADGVKQPESRQPVAFLSQLAALPENALVIAKDLSYFLDDPTCIRLLLDQAQKTVAAAVLALGPEFDLPTSLRKATTLLRLPLPDFEETAGCLEQSLKERAPSLDVSPEFKERMVKAVIGLSLAQARRAFNRVVAGRNDLGEEVMTQLVSEKKQLLQGSDLLEFHDLDETADDIGGLDGLKDWITRRSRAFSPEAQKKQVGQPKGVLLLGVQGCGKSLSARVIARQLSFPLIRLDFGNLLQSERGTSEQNLREVLRMMDSIAPAVLWIEELDKGFSGLDGGGDEQGDAAVSRMFGLFLTWMQEHKSPIFVVATANNIESLPPELLRRGRFDELFFIDLPNFHERNHIYRIHLAKRGCNPEQYNLEEISDKTEGYSGAEIEQIINSAVIEAFTRDRLPTQKDILDAADAIVPLSITMEEKIFNLREWARERCRPATPDSRVFRMIEDEHRKGELTHEDYDFPDPWMAPLKAGDLSRAVLEYVRAVDNILFPKLLEEFQKHMPVTGQSAIALESDTNIHIWQGLNHELAEAIARYVNNKRIFLNPIDAKAYLKIGQILKVPCLPELREKRLPREVWYPVSLRIMPPPQGSGRLRSVVVIEEEKPV
ncbi:AAA family ATPase [Rubinisphaera margarita]|uniref:AAA family ATPase n=1 Tax=Rubinisphaera margarita TaxID=2909586 RepID=UPI001EE81FDC|nr:AAA family ATPase [Rubinisphaera margarita]MCG6157402.1 AAA family ATPase [Rubinisphaera margarita]